jgi:hypothetical protein
MGDWLYAMRPTRDGFFEAPNDAEMAAMQAHYEYRKDATAPG